MMERHSVTIVKNPPGTHETFWMSYCCRRPMSNTDIYYRITVVREDNSHVGANGPEMKIVGTSVIELCEGCFGALQKSINDIS